MIDMSLLPAAQTAGRPHAGRPRRAFRLPRLRTALPETRTDATGLRGRSTHQGQPAVPGVDASPGSVDAAAAPVSSDQDRPADRDGRLDGGDDGSAAAQDAGMSTVEYAVGTVVAAAFAAVLYKIVTGDSVVTGLTNLIDTALSSTF